MGSRPFVLHTNHRDPLVLSQEKKGGKEVSVWDLDQNGQFICLLGQNISMMSPNPNREERGEEEKKRRRKRRREERREERRQRGRLHGAGRPWQGPLEEEVAGSRGQQADLLGEVGDGRPPHEGEEEQVARTQASTAW